MSMYPPLKFVEQLEHYIFPSNSPKDEDFVNETAMKFADDFISKSRSKFYHDFIAMINSPTYSQAKEIINYYAPVEADFCKKLRTSDILPIDTFFGLLLNYDVRSIWRKNKLSYLVDDTLFETLMTMEVPRSITLDCLTKLPADCFYIDYNNSGNKIMDDLDGSFVIVDKTDEELNMVMLHLFRGKNGDELHFTTASITKLIGSKELNLGYDVDAKQTFVDDDGVKRTIHIGKYMQFIYNFFVYLQASNRDVEISERTRQNHTKPIQTIKNKFREVKEFEVGFVYGRTIGKDAKRVKYVGEAEGTGVHSPKASHYRSAHWHHYWVGSGDDKRLIIKWIEGIFVKGNGDEAKNIRVCKVV